MVGGEHSLKISTPQLSKFGIVSVLEILNKRITLINHKGLYRTAPATPGLLISLKQKMLLSPHTSYKIENSVQYFTTEQ